MPTPDSPISLQDVKDEFGDSNGGSISLDEYYAGGLNVPAGTSGVPSSGTISLNDLRNKSKVQPLNISVTPSSSPEGQSFTVTITDPSNINRPTIYWKLTNYTNLDNSDFLLFQGSVNYSSGYANFTVTPVINDSLTEGPGTFRITFYSDVNRTIQIGQSAVLTVTDAYSLGTMTRSRTQIYRYANLNTALMSSTITLPSSGLIGSTIYWEVYGDSGVTISTADLVALSGTLTVPANGTIQATITATIWDGLIDITTNKNIYIRFKFNNSSGTEIANSLSLPIVLTRKPVISLSFDPSIIREGFSTKRTIVLEHVPYTDGDNYTTSIFYTTNQFDLDTATASDLYNFSATGEIIIDSNRVEDTFYATLDSDTESTQNISHVLRLNGTTTTNPAHTPIFAQNLGIESPAILTQSPNIITTSRSSLKITNIAPYPVARSFNTKFRHAGSTTWYENTLTVGALATSSQEIVPISTANPPDINGTAANHTLEFEITNPNYQIFTTSITESFIWPVGAVILTITNANQQGVNRALIVTVQSPRNYATARAYDIQYRIKFTNAQWPSDVNEGWTTFGINATISANSFTSPSTTVFQRPAALRGDVQVRCVLAGHQILISNDLVDVWF